MGVKGKEEGSKQTKTWRCKTFSGKESKGNEPREKNPRCQNKSTRGEKRARGGSSLSFSIHERCSLWFLPSRAVPFRSP
jgi:hypothetical protein